jgi:hypothetical protein
VQRVLVFNFFNGIKERGIPLYARELEKCFERIGIGHVELACPLWARRLHPALLNLMFVAFEQIVAPLVALLRGCAVTVYPYNSCGVIDAVLGRSVMVVHDLIPNERASRGLAAAYIRSTQIIHCALRRPVCAVSEHTLKTLRRLERYARLPDWRVKRCRGVRNASCCAAVSGPTKTSSARCSCSSSAQISMTRSCA